MDTASTGNIYPSCYPKADEDERDTKTGLAPPLEHDAVHLSLVMVFSPRFPLYGDYLPLKDNVLPSVHHAAFV